MLAGQEFATCSDDDFRAYIIGWTLVWSGIIPYTFIASKVRVTTTRGHPAEPRDVHMYCP